MGVIAPSQVVPVRLKTYKLPQKIRTPMKKKRLLYRISLDPLFLARSPAISMAKAW
jgi:hypothetical protein